MGNGLSRRDAEQDIFYTLQYGEHSFVVLPDQPPPIESSVFTGLTTLENYQAYECLANGEDERFLLLLFFIHILREYVRPVSPEITNWRFTYLVNLKEMTDYDNGAMTHEEMLLGPTVNPEVVILIERVFAKIDTVTDLFAKKHKHCEDWERKQSVSVFASAVDSLCDSGGLKPCDPGSVAVRTFYSFSEGIMKFV